MRSQSILCVDPDCESQALLLEILREHEPVVASDAYEALGKLSRQLFDAYVLESRLPDFSGLALCREIHRTDPRGPVIFCSGAARGQDRLLALQAGANAYICKPVEPAELLKHLRVLTELADLESARATAAARSAVAKELKRHDAQRFQGVGSVRAMALGAVERLCKTRAFTAYADKGGTRANFERSWEALFADLAAELHVPVIE